MANLQLSEQRNKQKDKKLRLTSKFPVLCKEKKGIAASQIKHPQKDAYTQMSSIERKQKTGKLFWQSFFYDTTTELKKKTNFANDIKFQTELYEIQQRHQLLPSSFNMPGHTCTYNKFWRHIS